MTETKELNNHIEKCCGASLLPVAVKLKKLTDRGIARLFLLQPAFYTFICASQTAIFMHIVCAMYPEGWEDDDCPDYTAD